MVEFKTDGIDGELDTIDSGPSVSVLGQTRVEDKLKAMFETDKVKLIT